MDEALKVDQLRKCFGGVVALDGVGFSVARGEVLGLIGPNGSGKSTLVNAISGFSHADSGRVELAGRALGRSAPWRIRTLGLSRTFQNLRLVDDVSVLDNVLTGMHLLYSSGRRFHLGWIGEMFGSPAARRRHREAHDRALHALGEVDLLDVVGHRAGSLSYGQRKRLELARAIALPPDVLLLDEPTAGLENDEATELMRLIVGLAGEGQGMAILLIEHRLQLIADLCHRMAVMDSGRLVAQGDPVDVVGDPDVLRIYVGETS